MFAGNFAPSGWAFCNGQELAISENTVLFNLIGTTYGGNGTTTFNLPDLRSRVPIHQGQGSGLSPYVIGETYGEEQVTLTAAQLPSHSHAFVSVASATLNSPAGNVPSGSPSGPLMYTSGTSNNVTLNSSASLAAGGNQPHANLMPYLCTSFIISLFGIYPSQA
jgi:microcystin-dependent protein